MTSQPLVFKLQVDNKQAIDSINAFFQIYEKGVKGISEDLGEALGQKVNKEIVLELKNGKLVAKEVKQVDKATQKIVDTTKALNKQWGKTPKELRRQIQALRDLRDGTKKFKDGTDKVTKKWKKLTKRLEEAEELLRKMGEGGGGGGGGAGGFFKKLIGAELIANLAAAAIKSLADRVLEFGQKAFQTGVQMETLFLQLTAFTGGAEEAERAFAEFKSIASESPLDLAEVAGGAKILLAYGVNANQAGESIRQLATIAGVTGASMDNMARNLGQIQAQGRAFTRDLTQFAINGIPIWDELSKVTGKNVIELREMAKDGEIGFQAVTAAFRNMTKEGSAYNQVAEQMGQTFEGMAAKKEASFQNLSRVIVAQIQEIDNVLGGPLKQTLQNQADNLDRLANAAKGAGVEIQLWAYALRDASNVGGGGGGFQQFLNDTVNKMIEMGVYANGFAMILNGVMPGAGALFEAFRGKVAASREEFFGIQTAAQDLKIPLGELTNDIMLLNAEGGESRTIVDNFKEQGIALNEAKTALEGQLQVLMELKGMDKEFFADRIAGLEQTVQLHRDEMVAIENKAATEIQAIKEAMDERKEASKAIIAGLDEQIAKTRELGPAGQKLARLKRKELEYTARTGKEMKDTLTTEQRRKLEAKARLEQLDAQAEREKLQKKRAEEMKKLAQEQKIAQEKIIEIEERKAEQMKIQETAINNLTEEITELKDILGGDLAGNYAKIQEIAEKLPDETAEQGTAVGIVNGEISKQVGIYEDIQDQIETTITKLQAMATAAREANRAAAAANAAPGSTDSNAVVARASGGPVSGGSTYQVNELGKEAFLSAAGKLSMINAPAFGKWKAPTSGTVIPAHLAKKLDVPSGGINISRTPSPSNFAGSTVTNVTGDTISNTVTIQAQNPTQTANNMMVTLARLKRARYS